MIFKYINVYTPFVSQGEPWGSQPYSISHKVWRLSVGIVIYLRQSADSIHHEQYLFISTRNVSQNCHRQHRGMKGLSYRYMHCPSDCKRNLQGALPKLGIKSIMLSPNFLWCHPDLWCGHKRKVARERGTSKPLLPSPQQLQSLSLSEAHCNTEYFH